MHPHALIQIGVCRLLGRKLDIAANRATTDLFRATVGCFHDAGPAASHDSEPEPGNGCAHFSSELVIRVVTLNPGRAKDGHTRTDKVESAKSAQEITHHSEQRDEFFEARTRAFEEDFIRAFC